eukprot:TRINITY_DN112595_c0_g1_i1.p1 TRINITY_DN112595_c0_g1~~TRINITY_DN112595_c0_g1_i1.p1  ORF type:complete len:540 (-),score=145.43 TRINITY_DN112595_c0_g1_i1:115-1734(-)
MGLNRAARPLRWLLPAAAVVASRWGLELAFTQSSVREQDTAGHARRSPRLRSSTRQQHLVADSASIPSGPYASKQQLARRRSPDARRKQASKLTKDTASRRKPADAQFPYKGLQSNDARGTYDAIFKQKTLAVPRFVKDLIKDNEFLAIDFLKTAADKGDLDAARHWLEETKKAGSLEEVSEDIFRSLFDAAAEVADVPAQRFWIEQAFEAGKTPRRGTVDRYIQMLASGDSDAAEKMASWADAADVTLEQKTLMTMLWSGGRQAKPGNIFKLRQALKRALAADAPLEQRVVRFLVNSAGKNMGLQAAEEVFRQVAASGFEHSIITYNAVMDVAAKQGDLDAVKRLFQEATSMGLESNLITFNTVLNAAGLRGNMSFAEKVFEQAENFNARPDLVSFTTLIRAAARRGDVKAAETWFSRAGEAGIRCDSIIYNTVIDAAGKAGELEKSLSWFQRMVDADIAPTVISFNTVMNAAVKANKPAEAVALFEKMMAAKVAPTSSTMRMLQYSLGRDRAVDLCRQHGIDFHAVASADRSKPIRP